MKHLRIPRKVKKRLKKLYRSFDNTMATSAIRIQRPVTYVSLKAAWRQLSEGGEIKPNFIYAQQYLALYTGVVANKRFPYIPNV